VGDDILTFVVGPLGVDRHFAVRLELKYNCSG